ncbi:MAG TPA: radical SAM protein, partial [Spirochaetia bacterium]|nr:radical SAM protein [Spirochaetia bacterium]
MFDHFDRPITYLRISVTDKCNLRCRYCMPPGGVPPRRHKDFLSFEQVTDVARAAVRLGVTKIRLTGGEPLVKRGIVELVRMLAGIPDLPHLAMTTNGTLLAGSAFPLRDAGLDSVNISLDTLLPDRYRFLTRGGAIHDVLDGIQAARDAAFPIKINMVVLEDTGQAEIEGMRQFCQEKCLGLQLINHFSLGGKKGERYGFDRPPSCATCNRIRLMADGMLKPCLHSDQEVALDFSRLEESLQEAV